MERALCAQPSHYFYWVYGITRIDILKLLRLFQDDAVQESGARPKTDTMPCQWDGL